jgi:hypothetical protein
VYIDNGPKQLLTDRFGRNRRKAGSRVRTDDLLITNQLLYQLSYAGASERQRLEFSGDSPPPQPDFSGALS